MAAAADKFSYEAGLRFEPVDGDRWWQCEVLDGATVIALLDYSVELRSGWHLYICRDLLPRPR